MKQHITPFSTALRFVLAAHARNRLALVLAVAFTPGWLFVTRVCTYHANLHFQVFPAGGYIDADNNRTSQVSSVMNSVTVITGFMAFIETLKSGPLERRLVLAGYRRRHLMAARVAALTVIAALLALYATALIDLSFAQRQVGGTALALFAANTAFGGLGIMLGFLLRGELEGFFVVIMTSIVDNGLQNPGLNPPADQRGLPFLPLYGPSQAAYAAAFTPSWPGIYAARGLVWFGLTVTVGMLAFWLRTRSYHRPRRPSRPTGRFASPATSPAPAPPATASTRPADHDAP